MPELNAVRHIDIVRGPASTVRRVAVCRPRRVRLREWPVQLTPCSGVGAAFSERETPKNPAAQPSHTQLHQRCGEAASVQLIRLLFKHTQLTPRLADQRAYRRRKQLQQRAIELTRERVLDFAGAAGLQMQAASRLWGHCFNCGKTLTDPISLKQRYRFRLLP